VEGGEQGEALVAAYVHVFTKSSKQPVLTVMTDEHGLATVDVNDSTSFIEVTSIGYAPVKVPLNAEVPNIKIKLTKTFSGLDEVVVTGVTAPVKLQNALSPYQIITKAAMQAQGAVTVKDALKNQLNVNMGNDAMLGSKTQMQGMEGDKVKILIDGVALTGREYGQIDLGQINLNNVERIEVVQGPMSVVYGTDALGGVINIITKKNNIPWRLEAGGYYETIGQYNFDLAGTYKIRNRHQVTLGGGRNFFQGWYPLDPLERSFLWKPKEQYIGNLAYSYTAASSFRLQFASDFVREKLSLKDANYIVTPFEATARDQYFRNTRLTNRLSMSGHLGSGAWQMQNAYNLYYRTKSSYVKNLVTLDQVKSQARGGQDTTRFDDFISRGTYSDTLRKIEYTIGYDINVQNGRTNKIDGGSAQVGDYAAFLTATYGLMGNRLRLQPALRYSYNTVYAVPLVPSLNVLYSHSEALQFRISYAKGFRAPSLKELYLHFYDSNHEVEGNKDLEAEQGHHVQVSTSWTTYRKETDFLKFVVTGFHNDVFNQISLYMPDPNQPLFATYTNVDRMRNLIGNLQADGQWNRLYMQLGYSITHILDADPGVNATFGQATATVQYRLKKPGINISLFAKHVGKQPNLETTVDGGTIYSGTMGQYTFLDASVEKRFMKDRVQIIAGLKNIMDVQSPAVSGMQNHGPHSAAGSALTTGRSFFTSVRLTLQ
jgi:outer membrane receptor for ferrienterochelin and colicins